MLVNGQENQYHRSKLYRNICREYCRKRVYVIRGASLANEED